MNLKIILGEVMHVPKYLKKQTKKSFIFSFICTDAHKFNLYCSIEILNSAVHFYYSSRKEVILVQTDIMESFIESTTQL